MADVGHSIREMKTIYGYGKTFTYALIKSGELQKAKVHGKTIVTRESAEALFARSLIAGDR
jgi:hypothetical protein